MNSTAGLGQPRTLKASVPMAVFDAVPVVLFCAIVVLIGSAFGSPLFWAGAICCIAAGLGKVVWKLVLAIAHRNIAWLNRQFRILMSLGFALCAIAVVIVAAILAAL